MIIRINVYCPEKKIFYNIETTGENEDFLLVSHLEKCGLNVNDDRKKSKDNKTK